MKRLFGLANFAGLFGALFFTAFVGWRPPAQQGTDQQYFPETGHTVREPFLDYFNRTGGVNTYGFPITDDYVDPQTGLLIQYFEKARLEWHPGNPEPYKVQLGLLGDELGKRQPPIPVGQIPAANDPNCMYFNATGHSVCMLFRDYWLQNGGLDRFGYPIGEFTNEDGRLVQWFQRVRMEWHPEKPKGQQIQLAAIGSIYYRVKDLDPTRLPPSGADWASLSSNVRSLEGRGSVVNSVAVAEGSQTAFVYVTDQLGNPIGGAAVTAVIKYPDGDVVLPLPPTSAAGTTFRTFTVGSANPGTIVSVDFIIAYEGVFAETRTSFMIWY